MQYLEQLASSLLIMAMGVLGVAPQSQVDRLENKISALNNRLVVARSEAKITRDQLDLVQAKSDLQNNLLGATIPTPVASFETSLQAKISDTDTTMTLVSTSTLDGKNLTNGKVFGFVIDERGSNIEYVVGTASSSNIINMTRGISVVTGNTNVSALQKAHRRGASVKITDAPVLLVLSRIMNGDETIPNLIKYATTTGACAQVDELCDKEYIDAGLNAGAADATDDTEGIVMFSTRTEFQRGNTTSSPSSSFGMVPQNRFFNATSTATTTGVVTRESGKISQGFIDLTESFTFTASTSLTATATLGAEVIAINQGEYFDAGITGQSTGDLFFATSSNKIDRLASSTPFGKILRSSSTPEWDGLAAIIQGTSTTGLTVQAQQTVATTTIPASFMDANGGMRIKALLTISNRNVSYQINYGGTNLASTTLDGASNDLYSVETEIINRAATNNQIGFTTAIATEDNTNVVVVTDKQTATIDSSASQTLTIKIKNQGGTSSASPVLEAFYIEPL